MTRAPHHETASARPIGGLITRARAGMRALHRRDDGAAAVEFGLIVPMMVVMFIGAVELSHVILVDRRVTQVGNATADLVARTEKRIEETEIRDIMRIGGFLMEPTSQEPLRVVLRNVSTSPNNATIAKQSWTCTYEGTGAGGTPVQSCACTNTSFSLPANLATTNDSVVVTEVTYAYRPIVFDYFMKQGGGGIGGTYPLQHTAYLKPRGQAAILVQPNNQPCPSPTF